MADVKTLIVKVVSCASSRFWYKDRIGDTFKVIDGVEKISDYEIADGSDVHRRYLERVDCEIVSEENSVEEFFGDWTKEVNENTLAQAFKYVALCLHKDVNLRGNYRLKIAALLLFLNDNRIPEFYERKKVSEEILNMLFPDPRLPSEVCEQERVQACHTCDDLTCGDNTSDAAIEARKRELPLDMKALDDKFGPEHYL